MAETIFIVELSIH